MNTKLGGSTRWIGAVILVILWLGSVAISGFLGGFIALQTQKTAPVVDDNAVAAQDKGSFSVSQLASSSDALTQPSALSVTDIYNQTTNAVVAISTESTLYNVFGQPSRTASAGSGFIISSDGYIVTNSHVIEGASTIKISLADGSTSTARLVGQDSISDIAVLKIDANGLPTLTLGDSNTLAVGNQVIAIGNPIGELANTLTVGVISAMGREINIDGTPLNMLQTDAAISPGNSGGPLINSAAQVIGINTAKSTANGVEGIGFAIPINDAQPVIEDLINQGYVSGRPQLGVSLAEVRQPFFNPYGLQQGVYVSTVDPGGAAERAGLQAGDMLVAIDGQAITSSSDLTAIKNQYTAGDTVTVTILRDNQQKQLSLTFDEDTSGQ
ncbi:MAG: PDZ domain-containing protein [Chloroflexi bacterium]|nr:PDZ domain-containing protein [Chloroflexota bacterium]